MKKRADDYNYQTRALEFQVGDQVALILGSDRDVGRVIEVYAAIGMIQVQWPNTTSRHPVEDVQRVNPGQAQYEAPKYQTVPGGEGTASVSLGPPVDDIPINNVKPLVQNVRRIDEIKKIAIEKVAKAFVKKSLYWHGSNRQYRCKRSEVDSGQYLCPKKSCDGTLRNAIYKREDGQSVKLYACPECLFLIRRQDVIDNSSCEEEGKIILASHPSKFIIDFITESLKDRKYREQASYAGLNAAKEGLSKKEALDSFIRTWEIPSLVKRETKFMEEIFQDRMFDLISKKHGLDVGEVEAFSTEKGMEIQGEFFGESYRGEVEAANPFYDFSREVESELKSLGPSQMKVTKKLEPDHRYSDLMNPVWKFEIGWNLESIQMEPPQDLQEDFLRGFAIGDRV